MRTVFNNDMCAHVWAQQTQSHGRNARGSLFFDGATLYSYGLHFKVGAFVVDAHGDTACLITTRTYSSTTQRHVSYAQRAASGNVFYVNDELWGDHDAIREDYAIRISQSLNKAKKARKHADMHMNDAERLISEANRYSDTFSLAWDAFTLDNSDDAIRKIHAKRVKQRKREARESWARKVAFLRDSHKQYIAWRAGKLKECPAPWRNAMQTHRLAYHESSDTVYTSGGASFPGEHARRAALPLLAALDRGAELNQTLRLGHFRIDAIGDTIKAGCHRVSKREARRMVRRLIGA